MAINNSWNDEDNWWRNNFSSRPYATGRSYEDFRPGYQYGFESGQHHMGRSWDDVESDLRTGWDKFEGKGRHVGERQGCRQRRLAPRYRPTRPGHQPYERVLSKRVQSVLAVKRIKEDLGARNFTSRAFPFRS